MNLSFANAGLVEEFIDAALTRRSEIQHVVLIATSSSHIDATALEALESLAMDLRRAGVTLHLSEVKGPVLDALKRSDLIGKLAPGRVYFRTEEAVRELAEMGPRSPDESAAASRSRG
jgi:SulP family sulfate permease